MYIIIIGPKGIHKKYPTLDQLVKLTAKSVVFFQAFHI